MKAILVTDNHYNALGVLRSLDENNIYVILILLNTEKCFVEYSKYADKCIKIEKSEINIINVIKEVANSSDEFIVYPLCDYAALVIDENYKEFHSNIIIPGMQGNMRKYLNKDYAKKEAKENGLNIAEGRIIENFEISKLHWDVFPAILKPVQSIDGIKQDIVKVNSIEEMKLKLFELKSKGYERILAEKYITGEDEHMIEVMGYCSIKKEVVICGIVEKIREYPIINGSTSFAKIVKNHKAIDKEVIAQFIKSSNFYGIFDLEFKYAEGKIYFIECNFRNGAPSYAVTISGNNIPSLWFMDSNDNENINYVKENKELLFMCEQYDVINMLKGYISPFKWFIEYSKSAKIFVDKSDLKPYIIYFYEMAKQIFKIKK